MHILYLIDSLVPGGAERSLASLAPFYVAGGMQLDVAYLHDRPGLQSALESAGAELFPLRSGRDRRRSIKLLRLLVKQRSPDLVHTTLFEADIAGRVAARLSHVPVVSSLVNIEYGPEQLGDPHLAGWKLRGAQMVDLSTARLVRRFHAVSRHVAEVMARRLLIRRNQIDVIPRGRDPARLGERSAHRRATARAAMHVDPSTPVVLAVARHEYQKGLDIAIDAFPLILRKLPGARLLIAGREGDQTAELRESVARLSVEDVVSFLGVRDDVPELLCGADAFVSPSRWEGLPGSVLEAMALETPIVATDIPTTREAVGEDCALLAPMGRPDALADATVATLLDPVAAARRSSRARTRFLERFTQDVVAAGMLSFYRRALS